MDDYDEAVARLLAAISESAAAIKSSPLYADERNRASGLEHLLRTMYQSIDRVFWQDPDYPLFRKLDFRGGYGGDNPDQQYLQTFIKGGETYRIWGRLGTERLVDIRLYEGLPWAGGKVAAHLTSHELEIEPGGEIEIFAAPSQVGRNWLQNPPGGTEILIRQMCGDWRKEQPGVLHIDRVGHEGDLKPNAALADVAARTILISEWLSFGVKTFQDLVVQQILPIPVNTIGKPLAKTEWQGMAARIRAYAYGHFDLADDEALLVTAWPVNGEYQSITINNLWYFNPEYQNRQSSLSDRQAAITSDGAYHFAVCAADPGICNWLDTTGLRRGIVMLRYDGVPAEGFSPQLWPSARKVKLNNVRTELPSDAPAVDTEGRSAAIRERRADIQIRNAQ